MIIVDILIAAAGAFFVYRVACLIRNDRLELSKQHEVETERLRREEAREKVYTEPPERQEPPWGSPGSSRSE